MSQQTVTCPSCNTMLRSSKVIPAGTNLRCPGCRSPFTAPSDPIDEPQTSPGVGAPVLIAVVGAVLLLGIAGVTAALFVALRSHQQAAATNPPNLPVVNELPVLKEDRKDDKKPDEELEKKRKELADAQEKLEQEKAKLRHDALVVKAEQALNKKNFPDAVKFYREALELFPSEKTTATALATALVAEMEAKKVAEESEKRKKEIDRLLADGREAMKVKKYEIAIRAFEDARLLDVSNKDVRDALDEARNAQDKDKGDKKRKDDYEAHLAAAKAALKAEDFVGAAREAQAALRLMPDDVEAGKIVQAADAKLDNLKDVKKRQAAFDRLIDQARKARDAARFNDATQAVDAALRLFPDDREAKRLSVDVKTALTRARADNAKLLGDAEAELRLGNLAEAKALAANAVKNWAEDAKAEALLRQIDRLTVNNGGGNDQEAMRQAYVRAVQLGQAAMLAERYADAVIAYGKAVELLPNDLVSARELEKARRLLKRQQERKIEYDRQMQIGTQALQRNQFARAVDAFEEALRAFPNDPTARLNLSKARYGKAMADGDRLYAILRQQPSQQLKDQAIQAYEAALEEKPRDQAAEGKLQVVRGIRPPQAKEPPKEPPAKEPPTKPKFKKDKK